jgi:predicted XRE-type DNA-binding protein
MANRDTEATVDTSEIITRGTSNVFADVGFADAEERQTKLRLAYAINTVVGRQRLTQVAAAAKLGVNQPKVSALANYKLDGFSVERLMTFLTALDQDVEIVIRKKPRSRATGRISVIDEVFGALSSAEQPLSLEAMDAAVAAEAKRRARD